MVAARIFPSLALSYTIFHLHPLSAFSYITIAIFSHRFVIRINKFFEVDFAIKVNASNERRFDRSTVIFKFGVRIKLHV